MKTCIDLRRKSDKDQRRERVNKRDAYGGSKRKLKSAAINTDDRGG